MALPRSTKQGWFSAYCRSATPMSPWFHPSSKAMLRLRPWLQILQLLSWSSNGRRMRCWKQLTEDRDGHERCLPWWSWWWRSCQGWWVERRSSCCCFWKRTNIRNILYLRTSRKSMLFQLICAFIKYAILSSDAEKHTNDQGLPFLLQWREMARCYLCPCWVKSRCRMRGGYQLSLFYRSSVIQAQSCWLMRVRPKV